MKFNVVTRIQWRHPTDPIMALRRNFETSVFTTRMQLQNKTVYFYVKHIDDTTVERPWADQEAAEAYIQHQQQVAVKYGGKIVSFEIRNVD